MLDITQQAFNQAIKDAFEAGVESGKREQYEIMLNELENLNLEYKLKKAPGLVFVAIRIMTKRLRHEF